MPGGHTQRRKILRVGRSWEVPRTGIRGKVRGQMIRPLILRVDD